MANWGLLGGIGEGLKQGIDSYRVERDYQRQKQKDAIEQKLKGSQVYGENLKSFADLYSRVGPGPLAEKAWNNAGLEGDFGPYSEENARKITGGSPVSSVGPQAPSSDNKQEASPQAQASPPGLMNQKPGLLTPEEEAQYTSLHRVTPGESKLFAGQMNMAGPSAQIASQNRAQIEKGRETGIAQVIDPQTGQSKSVRVGMSPLAGATLKEKNIQPVVSLNSEFKKDPVYISNMNTLQAGHRILEAKDHPSPKNDDAISNDFAKIASFGQATTNLTQEEATTVHSLQDRIKNNTARLSSGLLDPTVRQDMIRATLAMQRGAIEQMRNHQADYAKLAKENGVSPSFTKLRDVDEMEKRIQKEMAAIPDYQKPSARGGIEGLMGKVLEGPGFLKTSPEAVASPKNPSTQDFNKMSDQDLYKLWQQKQSGK